MAVIKKPNGPMQRRQKRRNSASTVLILMIGVPIIVSSLALGFAAYFVFSSTDASAGTVASPSSAASASSAQDQGKQYSPSDLGLDSSGNKYHIIFSTGCSAFQDWQSYVFFYHAWKIRQPGIVTRIVSGCHDHDQEKLQQIFDEQIKPMAPDRFKIHFTPDYSGVKEGTNYKYFNKPFGTKHWLEHSLGYPGNPIDEDSIVILLDPDQLILRPFENNDFSNTEWMYLKPNEKPRTRIEHGKPMGQLYGFDLQWKRLTTMQHVAPDELPSPVDSLTDEEARAGYPVGPPYIATARDMYAIATKWCQFVPLVHDEYPHLLAEMFAYCLAAAHLKLPHQSAASFMVSAPGLMRGEGWNYIKRLKDDELCSSAVDQSRYPNVMHFCQRYTWGPWFFGKYRLPKTFLSCDHPLLAEPPSNLLEQYTEGIMPDGGPFRTRPEVARQHVFSVCRLIPAVNEAGLYFRQQHCPNGGNQNKTMVFNWGLGDNYTVDGHPKRHYDNKKG